MYSCTHCTINNCNVGLVRWRLCLYAGLVDKFRNICDWSGRGGKVVSSGYGRGTGVMEVTR